MIGRQVLVRTFSAGVHFGILAERNAKEVKLLAASRLWQWSGANTLSEVSQTGVSENSRISVSVPEIYLTEAIEVIPISDKALETLKPRWK